MKYDRHFYRDIVLFTLLVSASSPGVVQADESTIASNTATVEGVKLHYLTAGHGPNVVLLHGYTQTSHMWTQ